MTKSKNINRPKFDWRPEYVDFLRQHFADNLPNGITAITRHRLAG